MISGQLYMQTAKQKSENVLILFGCYHKCGKYQTLYDWGAHRDSPIHTTFSDLCPIWMSQQHQTLGIESVWRRGEGGVPVKIT